MAVTNIDEVSPMSHGRSVTMDCHMRQHLNALACALLVFCAVGMMAFHSCSLFEGYRVGVTYVICLGVTVVVLPISLCHMQLVQTSTAIQLFFILIHVDTFVINYVCKGAHSGHMVNLALCVWGISVGTPKSLIVSMGLCSSLYYCTIELLMLHGVDVFRYSDFIPKDEYIQGSPVLFAVFEWGFLNAMMSFFIVYEGLSFQTLIISHSKQEEAESQLKGDP